jgi:uncharacterized membrane protein YuzA (DUF378 family)
MVRNSKRVGSVNINQIGDVTNMEIVQIIGIILAVVGALNWGLVGLFKFDLVAFITGGNTFGQVNLLSRTIYIIVAAAGIVAATAITNI